MCEPIHAHAFVSKVDLSLLKYEFVAYVDSAAIVWLD